MTEFRKKGDRLTLAARPKAPTFQSSPSWKATVYGDPLTDYSPRVRLSIPILLLPPALLLSGCSLLFGNIAPVSEKSGKYEAGALPEGWNALSPQEMGEVVDDPDDNATSDFAFQSEKTQSIISINTACRPSLDWDELVPEGKRAAENRKQLRSFAQQLLMGIEPVGQIDEKEVTVSRLPALETTMSGKLNDSDTRVRTVVMRKRDCIYDLMFVAQPQHFDTDVEAFSRFVASFKVRR